MNNNEAENSSPSDVLQALQDVEKKVPPIREKSARERRPRAHKQNPIVNIAKIFAYDMRHLLSNVIGIVVVMGLIIVPSMYAWFNIAACWDPYGSTSQLKVAVANEDKGYSSDLISLPVNVGNTVESSLRASDKLDWQFVSKAKAVNGVYSGKYYAAIVIPKNFSARMLTAFSRDARQAKIEYYINEKSNAIAPKIAQQAADTVVTQVSSSFTEAVAHVALDVAENLGKIASSEQGKEYVRTVVNRLNAAASDVDSTATLLDGYSGILAAADGLVSSSEEIMSSSARGAADVQSDMKKTLGSVKSLASATDASARSVTTALDAAGKSLDSVLKQIDSLTGAVSSPTADIATRAQSLGTQLTDSTTRYQNLIDALTNLKNQVNASTVLSDAQKSRLGGALDAQISALSSVKSDVQAVGTHISTASMHVQDVQKTIATDKEALKRHITDSKKSLAQVKLSYDKDVKPQLAALASDMKAVQSSARNAGVLVSDVLRSAQDTGNKARHSVSDVVAQLNSTRDELRGAAQSMRNLAGTLDSGIATGTHTLSQLTKQDKSAAVLASELSAPVKLKRTPVFAIANYGSQMAAFYTVLAIWVGSVFLVAMMKISISDEEKAHVLGLGSKEELAAAVGAGFKPNTASNAARLGIGLGSEYWGRYLTFLVISLFQSGLLAMGDMWYLRVQHVSVWHFFFVAWLASLVFSSIMYALSLAFGAVGKAIAVIIMVMQIAGSGGTFPVQLLPPFFQHVYPLLPFPYALTAMHAAIAGSYGNEYWVAMGQFALFLVPALLVGLLIARPLARSNWFVDQLSKTGVYGE